MSKKILVAPNAFKECADPVEVCRLFIKYLPPDLITIPTPLSDGGDGFVKVLNFHFNFELLSFEAASPDGTFIPVESAYDRKSGTLYIESASVIGLKHVPSDKRNPVELSTAGLGELILRISSEVKVNRIVIGIGGTATNDLGLGMLSKLGLELYNSQNTPVEPLPKYFHKVVNFSWKPKIKVPIEIVIDVNNPLLGNEGTTYTYGPQKGLSENNIREIEQQFNRLIKIFGVKRRLAGAGGGLAAGLQLFYNAYVKKASEFILGDLRIKEYIDKCDVFITGEGAFDKQSLTGKGTGIIINSTNKPIFLVCGKLDKNLVLKSNVIPIEISKFFSSVSESMSQIERGIRLSVQKMLEFQII